MRSIYDVCGGYKGWFPLHKHGATAVHHPERGCQASDFLRCWVPSTVGGRFSTTFAVISFMTGSDRSGPDTSVFLADIDQSDDRCAESGLQHLRAIMRGERELPANLQSLGVKHVDAQPGQVSLTCTPDESISSAHDFRYLGIVSTLLDTATAAALLTVLPQGKSLSWMDSKVYRAKSDDHNERLFSVIGTLVEYCPTFGIANATVMTDLGAVVATARSTLRISGAPSMSENPGRRLTNDSGALAPVWPARLPMAVHRTEGHR